MPMTDNFIKNHKNILAAGPCLLIKEQGSPGPNEAHKLRNIGDTGYFSQDNVNTYYGIRISPVVDSTSYSMKMHGAGGGMEGIRLVGSATDKGVRYLDYYSNGVTTIALDGAARVVLTGPLEGCFVAVGRGFGGATYLFHVNDNKTKDDEQQNTLNKIRGIQDASRGYFSCTLKELLTRSDYADPVLPYRAFVYGVKDPSGTWNFFYHCSVFDDKWRVKVASDPLPQGW